jgi:tetratricopeptide (TPR) repeat protein
VTVRLLVPDIPPKALELIHEKDLFPELAYMFKHALTQDVAYNSLLEQRRCELHHLIGQAIEELYADRLPEQYEVLAYHFAKGQKWIKALDYLLKAADKATRSFANREAIALYDQALKIAEHPELTVDARTLMTIHRSRAGLFLVTSDFEGSRAEGEIVLDLARRTAEQRSEGVALIDLGYTALWMKDFDRALDYAHQAVKVGEKIDDRPLQAGGHYITGAVRAITGSPDRAKKTVDRVLTISRPANEMRYQSFALSLLGHLTNWQGAYAQAAQYLSEGLHIARANNLLAPLFENLFMYGITLVGKGDYDQALSTLKEGMDFCAKVGDEVYYLRMMNTLGWLYIECGDLNRSVDFNRRAADGARQRGDPETIANSGLNLADALLAQNDLAAARETLEGVYRIVRNPATSDWMKWRYSTHLFASYGEVLLASGEIEKAAAFAQRCLQIATRTDSRKYLVKGLRLEGDIAFARRQWDDSEIAYRRALSIAQAIRNPTQLWKTHLALGQYYRRRKQPEQAQQSLRAARDVIDQVLSSLQTPGLRQSLQSYPLVQRVVELNAC